MSGEDRTIRMKRSVTNGKDEEESGSSFSAKGGRAGKGGGIPEKQPRYQKNEGLHGPGPAEVQEDARVHS